MVVISRSNRNALHVLRAFLVLSILGAVVTVVRPAEAAPETETGRIRKVLPHLLDADGRHTVSPSLFDRDAYQSWLRQHPEQVSGIRYDVLWKARGLDGRTLTVRVELRGMFEGKVPREMVLEEHLTGQRKAGGWTRMELTDRAYRDFGKITAWRATLWCEDQMLDEQQSFLW